MRAGSRDVGVAKRLSTGCSDGFDPSSLTAAEKKKREEDQGWIVWSSPQSLSSLLAGERQIRKAAKQFPLRSCRPNKLNQAQASSTKPNQAEASSPGAIRLNLPTILILA